MNLQQISSLEVQLETVVSHFKVNIKSGRIEIRSVSTNWKFLCLVLMFFLTLSVVQLCYRFVHFCCIFHCGVISADLSGTAESNPCLIMAYLHGKCTLICSVRLKNNKLRWDRNTTGLN